MPYLLIIMNALLAPTLAPVTLLGFAIGSVCLLGGLFRFVGGAGRGLQGRSLAEPKPRPASPPHEFSVHTAYSVQREGLGGFPFFTLPEGEKALLAEFRALVETFEAGRGADQPPVSFGELSLAGRSGPEVAFVLRWDCLRDLRRLTRKGSEALRLHFGGWYGGPKPDLLPAGLDVPRDAFPSLGFEFSHPDGGPFFPPSEDCANLWTVVSHPDERVGQVWQSREGVFHAETPDGLTGEAAFVDLCSWPQVSCSQTAIWLGSEDSRGIPDRTIFRSPAEFLPADLQLAAD